MSIYTIFCHFCVLHIYILHYMTEKSKSFYETNLKNIVKPLENCSQFSSGLTMNYIPTMLCIVNDSKNRYLKSFPLFK